MNRPEFEVDPTLAFTEAVVLPTPNTYMLDIMSQAERLTPTDDMNLREMFHQRNIELLARHREGDPSALGQMLLNSAGMARRLLFGKDRVNNAQPPIPPVVHDHLAEIPSLDIDDAWQNLMLAWFETSLPKWEPEAGRRLAGYLQMQDLPKGMLYKHFSVGRIPVAIGTQVATQISTQKHSAYETPLGTAYEGLEYRPAVTLPELLPLDKATEAAAIDYPGTDMQDRVVDHNIVLSLMDNLDERQKFVVAEVTGLLDGNPKEGKDIGEQLGLTRQRVSQIYHQAIKIMRERAEAQNTLDEYAMRERNLEQEQADEANFELRNMYSAAQAVFEKFIDHGITNPDDLDLSDPGVIAANTLLDAWSERIEPQTTELSDMLEFNLMRGTFYIEAGFTDPDYIDEVANDWLTQDADKARGAGLDDLAAKIEAKINELNNLLPSLTGRDS